MERYRFSCGQLGSIAALGHGLRGQQCEGTHAGAALATGRAVVVAQRADDDIVLVRHGEGPRERSSRRHLGGWLRSSSSGSGSSQHLVGVVGGRGAAADARAAIDGAMATAGRSSGKLCGRALGELWESFPGLRHAAAAAAAAAAGRVAGEGGRAQSKLWQSVCGR